MDVYIFWTIVALGFLIAELFIPAAFSFLFTSLAAMITGFFCFYIGLSWLTSGIFFTGLTIFLLALVGNRYRSHWAQPHGDDLNNTLARLVHSSAIVTSIAEDSIKVRIGSYYWSAKKKSKDCEIVLNSTVRVVGYDQMTLLVTPVGSTKESH